MNNPPIPAIDTEVVRIIMNRGEPLVEPLGPVRYWFSAYEFVADNNRHSMEHWYPSAPFSGGPDSTTLGLAEVTRPFVYCSVEDVPEATKALSRYYVQSASDAIRKAQSLITKLESLMEKAKASR